jgi:hypothetical protein
VTAKIGTPRSRTPDYGRAPFHRTDSPGYIAGVLARFRDSIGSVVLKSREVDSKKKILLLKKSKIPFEEIHIRLDTCENLDLRLVFHLLSEATRIFSIKPRDYMSIRFPRSMGILPTTDLVSLDLNGVYCLTDNMIEAIVASCPQLELLSLENDDSTVSSRGIRAIADGLPNLVSLYFEGLGHDGNDASYADLLSKKPGLAALALGSGWADYPSLPRTAAQIPTLVDLQYLEVSAARGTRMLRNLFWNANFAQLKTLLLPSGNEDVHGADLKAMALACPNVETLALW